MTKQEFMTIFIKLSKYYGKNLDEEDTYIYYSSLKNMSVNDFRKKCNEFVKTSRFMPKVSEFLTYDKNGLRYDGIRVRSKYYDDLTDDEWEKFYTIGGRKDGR